MDSNTFLICTAIVSFGMIAIGILGVINEYLKQKAGTSKPDWVITADAGPWGFFEKDDDDDFICGYAGC